MHLSREQLKEKQADVAKEIAIGLHKKFKIDGLKVTCDVHPVYEGTQAKGYDYTVTLSDAGRLNWREKGYMRIYAAALLRRVVPRSEPKITVQNSPTFYNHAFMWIRPF